ncbi:ATP-dependent helicase HrpB [Candidatus Symbiopectobacterium sp. NZEC127]|uniref:ATP-dependent helicase HrpB n=1 Tax=Candidatus Symbiopectobacterium sp. NZEC127 TaxID=2820472 RepID=UPI002226B12C|nr:ATP-dependent helicase HrpB [Candidatus Symbiopectobacterium sp. NZEC127]MCW2488736.1 ATP-dependent helicase HrpB [Candidatus Symbiopectobacterium sp. NZEC127]
MSLPPVSAVLNEVIDALGRAPQVLLHAPTGAGKSTWLPLKLLEMGGFSGRIILLEPRRLAAKNVAWRLAEQLGETPGGTVGYRMRAETRVGPQTRIEVVTEGVLTRMLQRDAELTGVSLVILDEFHERSLQADLALALLLDVQQGLREDLALLIMSATLDNARLAALLPMAETVVSQGRAFPVDRNYQPLGSQERLEEGIARQIRRLLTEQSGSALVFLPGVAEIKRVEAMLQETLASDVDICPLYGALTLADQQKAIHPAVPGRRKVVLSTNIAETSLTIEGIRLVVDSGLERVARFDVKSGLTRLVTQRISQASMTQRAGRAGRLEAGLCVHLCAKEQAERAAAQSSPEILNSDLSSVWLELLQWGCTSVESLTWLDTPPLPAFDAARRLLTQLQVTDNAGKLTTRGRHIARLGIEPRLAAMLHSTAQQDAQTQATACLLAALLEEPPRTGALDIERLLARPSPSWRQRATQLMTRLAGKSASWREPQHFATLPALLAFAYPDRIAQRRSADGRYQLASGLGARLPLDEPLAAQEWLIVPALMLAEGTQSADARITLALPVDIEALIAQRPDLVSEQNIVHWDEEKGTLRASRREGIGCLTLRQQPLNKPSAEAMQQALLNWVREQGLSALNWQTDAEQLRIRVACAQRWLAEGNWPAMDDEALLATLDTWLLPSLNGVRDVRTLRNLDLYDALLRLLDWPMRQRLESALPRHYTAPGGSHLPLRYHHDRPPALAVRMQEMFGERQNPTVAEGRVAVVLELLSPAHRPLQITRDLAAFWQGAYREVQKEMKGRYPKHVWPDDPANTAPTRRTKKYQAP